MSRGGYERLPMYAHSESNTSRLRLSLRSPSSPYALHSILQQSSPFRTRSRSSPLIRPGTVFTIIKYLIPTSVVILFVGYFLYEPHVELAFYNRGWIQAEIKPVPPLAGCFNEGRVGASYNVSEYVYGRKRSEVHAGMSLRMGLDCYDFAGTIQPTPLHERSRPGHVRLEDRTHFHTYWRTDLVPFGERQEWMLKSFFATQDLDTSILILWSNGDLSSNNIIQIYLRRYPSSFDVRVVDIHELARGTELEGSRLLISKDKKAWVDGDLVRLLLLWSYGGVWVDMDSLLTRDLEPLLEHEFVTQWDCYDKIYRPMNGALMRFRQHSPYLCEAFHVIAISPPPRSGSADWGALLYLKLWRRLVASHIPPFKILPFCLSDGRTCRLDNRLPDPFTPDKKSWTMGLGMEEGGGLDKTLGKVFGVHLHNQWEMSFPKGGWVERLLLKRYDEKLGISRN